MTKGRPVRPHGSGGDTWGDVSQPIDWDSINDPAAEAAIKGELASAIEARQSQDGATRLGPQGESAVAKPDAQGTTP